MADPVNDVTLRLRNIALAWPRSRLYFWCKLIDKISVLIHIQCPKTVQNLIFIILENQPELKSQSTSFIIKIWDVSLKTYYTQLLITQEKVIFPGFFYVFTIVNILVLPSKITQFFTYVYEGFSVKPLVCVELHRF
jgi:hypothetical protein